MTYLTCAVLFATGVWLTSLDDDLYFLLGIAVVWVTVLLAVSTLMVPGALR